MLLCNIYFGLRIGWIGREILPRNYLEHAVLQEMWRVRLKRHIFVLTQLLFTGDMAKIILFCYMLHTLSV